MSAAESHLRRFLRTGDGEALARWSDECHGGELPKGFEDELRRFGTSVYVGAIMLIDPTRVRRIPSTAVTGEREGEADVVCPCGHHPVVTERLAKCPGCERWYVLERGAVYVIYGAMTPPPLVPVLREKRDDPDEGNQDRDHDRGDHLGGPGAA